MNIKSKVSFRITLALTCLALITTALGAGHAASPKLDAVSAAAPTIDKLKIPKSVDCISVFEVKLKWRTTNAKVVTIAIDGPGLYGYYQPDGSAIVPFACDGNSHSYTLTAVGKNGKQVAITKVVKQQ